MLRSCHNGVIVIVSFQLVNSVDIKLGFPYKESLSFLVPHLDIDVQISVSTYQCVVIVHSQGEVLEIFFVNVSGNMFQCFISQPSEECNYFDSCYTW